MLLSSHDGTVCTIRAVEVVMARNKSSLTPPGDPPGVSADQLSSALEERAREELVAVTEEMREKVQELDRLNSDMANILASSGVATVLLDGSLRVKSFTPAVAPILGLDSSSLGHPLPPFVAELGSGSLMHDADLVLHTCIPRERELTLPGGRHYLVRFFPYRDSDGSIDGVVLTFVDLTDRKEMEDALRNGEARQRLFIEHAPAALAMFDRHMRYILASERWLSDYGLRGQDVKGKSHYELFPDLSPAWREAHARGMAGEVVRSDGDPFVRQDGTVQWVRWELRPWHELSGAIGGIVIFAEDITDLKEAEGALRHTSDAAEESLAQMHTILDTLTEGVLITDLEGKPFHWNPAAMAMYDFRGGEEDVRAFSDFQGIFELSQDDGRVLSFDEWPLRRILRGEVLSGLELRVRRLDREWERTFSYRGRLARDSEGHPLMAVLSMIDTTERKESEKLQARLAAIVESSEDAIVAKDLNGIIRTWNKGAEEMFGYRAEEIVGKPVTLLIPPELVSEEDEILTSLRAGKRILPFETVRVARDGRRFHASVTVSALRDRRGHIIGASKIVRDIDERKHAEEALLQSNRRQNLLAESAGELLAAPSLSQALDAIGRRVMDFLDCQLFFSYFAEREERRLYLSAYAGISDAEADAIRRLDYGAAVCGCAAEEGCGVAAENIMESDDPRVALVKSYGVSAYACQPLMVRGRVQGTLSFGTRTRLHFSGEDLALMRAVADQVAIALERHRAEQALRDSEERLRLAYQAARIGTFDYDVKSGTTRWSPEMEGMYGVPHSAAPRRLSDWEDLLHPDGKEEAMHLLQQAFDSREPVEGEWQVLWPDGSVHWLLARFQVFRDPAGNAVRLIGVNYDVTERKQVLEDRKRIEETLRRAHEELELRVEERTKELATTVTILQGEIAERLEAEKALREETLERLRTVEELREKERLLIQQSRQAALGEMLGNIAHQWRQPLNSLGLMIQELSLSYESGQFSKEYLDNSVHDVMQLIHHMSQTIDDFRTFFRPEKVKTHFHVRKVLEKVLGIVEGSLKRYGIAVDVFADGDPVVYGYPNEYSQVVLNIVLNCRDAFLERGTQHPRIGIVLKTRGRKVVLQVSDNAGGIPTEIIDKIFDPYFTTKAPDKGTGVGLYMSKTIIEKNMRGSLTARNTPEGAVFTIEV